MHAYLSHTRTLYPQVPPLVSLPEGLLTTSLATSSSLATSVTTTSDEVNASATSSETVVKTRTSVVKETVAGVIATPSEPGVFTQRSVPSNDT